MFNQNDAVRIARGRYFLVSMLITPFIFALISYLAAQAAEESKPLYLVKDGRAVSTIVIPRISTQQTTQIIQQDPDKPVPCPKDADAWTTQAALWLQGYIRKATGAELKIVSEDELPTGTIISVGHTQLAAKAGIDVRNLKYDGCNLMVKGNVLYLLGRDIEKPLASSPLVGAHGTCRAVLMFLEDHCGVRWFLPTPEGEIIPQAKDISAPRNLAKSFVPAFAYSGGRFTYTTEFLGDGGGTPASIINNFRHAVACMPGGHTYYGAVPAAVYFKEHPEYFALINGKRTGEGNHLCTSNPDVKKILVKWTQDRFDEGYEWVSIGQEDGFRRCECPECEKMDDYRFESSGMGWDDFLYGALSKTPCERLFILHKAVIDEVAKSHPDKKVMLMCYAPTAWPSKKIHYFGDNVITELMQQGPEFLKAWQGKGTGVAGYVYWFNNQTPMGMDVHATPREVSEKIRYLYRNGFVGLYQFAESGWGFQGPSFYTLGRLMGDPLLDHKAVVEDYCRGLYGKAAGSMLQFFDLLYARHEKVIPLPVDDFNSRMDKMPPGMTTTKLYMTEYPPQFLKQLEEVLQKAEAEADTDRARGWVRLTRDHFDFTNLLTQALVSYQTWQADRSPKNWQDLKQSVEAFDAYRTKIITYPKEYTDRWFPGYDYFCNYLTADTQHESKVYYTPWEKRKAEAIKRGVKGVAIGYGGGWGYSFIKEPLTLDFSVRIQP